MQDKLARYKKLSAMADEDQTEEEMEEQVNLYYEIFHPKCECGMPLVFGHECFLGYWNGRQYLTTAKTQQQ